MNETLLALPFLVAAYLWGSIPWGFVIGKVFKRVDVREYGSGSTGMTNVMRTAGVVPGALVLLLDLGKGAAAVFVVKTLGGSPVLEMGCGLATLVGHNWSLFLRFQGGRGIASGLGALTVMAPGAGLAALAVGVPVILLSRYVSLGSLLGAASGASTILLLSLTKAQPLAYGLYGLLGLMIILFQHRANIKRLFNGTEHRLGQPAKRVREPVPKREQG